MQSRRIRNIQCLNSLLSIEFQRKVRPELAIGNPEIHGFGDGGEKAYGSVIFLRWNLGDGTFLCIPLMVKAFVAPLKKKSKTRTDGMSYPCQTLPNLQRSAIFIQDR